MKTILLGALLVGTTLAVYWRSDAGRHRARRPTGPNQDPWTVTYTGPVPTNAPAPPPPAEKTAPR